MTEEIANEKMSIRNSARSLKKYGSTSSHVKQNVNFVKHSVSSGDTLQGIALRYGCTTEQIRRTNRLWATDSLFLREYLTIPVSDDVQINANNGFSVGPSGSSVSEPALSRSGSTSVDNEEDSIDEFLGKIDNSIAITKNEVKKIQGNSEFVTNTDIGYERRKPAVSRMRQSANNNVSTTEPHAVVVTQSRKVRTSLQKMAKQQDEIFEL